MTGPTTADNDVVLPPLNYKNCAFTIIGALLWPSLSMLLCLLSSNLAELMVANALGSKPPSYHWDFHLHGVLMATSACLAVAVLTLGMRVSRPDFLLRVITVIRDIVRLKKVQNIATVAIMLLLAIVSPGFMIIAAGLIFSRASSR